MNLYRAHGKSEYTDKNGNQKMRSISAYIVAKSEDDAKKLANFEINHISIEASTEEEKFPRRLLVLSSKK